MFLVTVWSFIVFSVHSNNQVIALGQACITIVFCLCRLADPARAFSWLPQQRTADTGAGVGGGDDDDD